ncbi:MAG: transketolase [Planctomycetota bacterium]
MARTSTGEPAKPEAPAEQPNDLDRLAIDAIRVLAMDAVQKARSGHPGTPMALAPLGYVLWTRHMRHDPRDPGWIDRDRFVLSCGHASMLLYALLHLSGYDLSIEDVEAFRQWGSRTPGHPEYGHTPGVETTTGPLGQGVANAVGMALAEARLAAEFNHTGHYVVDHRTWFVCSDGDLQEGISHEAASLAGHLGLGKLIGFYDDNSITIEGERSLSDGEDVGARFEAYGWHVVHVDDGNDLAALDDAIDACKAELLRPSLVVVKTHIAWGSPNKQDTAAAHGAPLGEDEVAATRKNLGWQWEDPFYVPIEVREHWSGTVERGRELRESWEKVFKKHQSAFPAESAQLLARMANGLPDGWEDDLPHWDDEDGELATRQASGEVLNAIAGDLPALIGGSADLGPSNNTGLEGLGDFLGGRPQGRNLHFGIREHAMGAVLNGIALHGGLVPYAGTFLVFSDYMRPAIRLAALMGLGTIYVFTHDSIGLGEDGPTHQPIEQLAALRAIPGLHVIRPADAAETAEAWRCAVTRRDGPTAIVLTRQKVPFLSREPGAPASLVARGAYAIREEPGGHPDLVLLASGSEVALAIAAGEELSRRGHLVRVLSVPSLDRFAEQDRSWRDKVLPPECRRRLAVEAAHPMPWWRWVGSDGDVVGIERFGASAPYERLYEEYGLTVDVVVSRAEALLARDKA